MLQANLLFKVNGQMLCQDYIHLKITGIFCLQSRTTPNWKSITWRPTLIESQMWGLVKGALRHQLQQLHTSWAKSWLAIWSPPPPHALPTTFKPHLNIKSSRLHTKTLWTQKATSTFFLLVCSYQNWRPHLQRTGLASGYWTLTTWWQSGAGHHFNSRLHYKIKQKKNNRERMLHKKFSPSIALPPALL